jgi:ABC-type spermidine/putrescine transport system permease subunit II
VRIARYLPAFFLVAGIVLIPWTIYLTFSLPSHHESQNWQTVWAGFDIAEASALIATAILALRRSPWLAPVAAITGTLLCVDAWFDITLEAGGKHLMSAVVEAVLVELPLAGICFWVSRNAEHQILQTLRYPWQRAVVRALREPPAEADAFATSRDDR